MKIEALINREVETVERTASLSEALKKMENRNTNGLAVVEREKLVGIITKADIFRAILPSYFDLIENERYMTDPEFMEERVARLKTLKVEDVMTPNPYFLSEDTPIIKAGAIMVARRIKQIPVLKEGKLVGMLSLSDVLEYFSRYIR